MRLIEAYGTGILKINECYDEYDVKPLIETTGNAFKIHVPLANRLPVREHISLTTFAGDPNGQGVITIEQKPQLLSQAA